MNSLFIALQIPLQTQRISQVTPTGTKVSWLRNRLLLKKVAVLEAEGWGGGGKKKKMGDPKKKLLRPPG